MLENAKKFGKAISVVGIFLIVFVCGYFLANQLTSPQDINLTPGWQLIQLNGIVPKGSIAIIGSVKVGDTVLLCQNPRNRKATGFIQQGRINFYESMSVVTKTPVWVYFSKSYEFIIKKSAFSEECRQKMSQLTEKKVISIDEYDVGHQ